MSTTYWIPFTNEQRIRFLDLLLRLNRPLFIQLSDFEKSLFYHYWYNILNEHDCWLLHQSNQDVAFVSRPSWQTKHWMRWPESILLYDKTIIGTLVLPEEIRGETAFRTGHISQNMRQLQTAYALNLTHFQTNNYEIRHPDTQFLTIGSQHLDQLNDLLSKPEHVSESYYRDELKRMVLRNQDDSYGLGYYATVAGKPMAIVFYEAFQLPLTGTPCMLVSDILVDTEHRRKGIATHLQQFAYLDMQSRGIHWVLGNIDSDNEASRKQAEKLQRIPWAYQVKIEDGLSSIYSTEQ